MQLERQEDRIRVLAPAKLNLYLEVGPRRPDGFHDIDSIFQAVTLYDELDLETTQDGRVTLQEQGIVEEEKNLVFQAAALFRHEFLDARDPRGVRISLRKRIPQGAGLGGGSSDAAATLVGVNELWGVGVPRESLVPIAARLGSDVPFFLFGGTARCRGRGEIVEPYGESFDRGDAFHYVLVYPRLQVPTKTAYQSLDAARGSSFTLTPSSALDSMPLNELRVRLSAGELFFNRFEEVVFPAFAELKELRDRLGEESFVNVLMSGSGSTIYGLCRSREEAEEIAARLRSRLEADVFAVSSETGESGD
jgi:4-diphosphocytidyl-2-C-methyl-D-erythritol kinase